MPNKQFHGMTVKALETQLANRLTRNYRGATASYRALTTIGAGGELGPLGQRNTPALTLRARTRTANKGTPAAAAIIAQTHAPTMATPIFTGFRVLTTLPTDPLTVAS